jgi:hypothetical protein
MLRPNGESTAPLDLVLRLYRNLADLTVRALAALAEEVIGDSAEKKNLPPNATVHRITSNTLRCSPAFRIPWARAVEV